MTVSNSPPNVEAGASARGDRKPGLSAELRFRATALTAWWLRNLEIERRSRSGFTWLPLGMLLGIVLFHGMEWRPPPVVVASMTAAAFGALVVFPLGSLTTFVLTVSAWVGVGVVAADIEIRRTETVILSGEATVRIEGPVLLREQDDRGRYRYTVEIASTDRPVLSRPPSRVRILVSSRHSPLPIGATYRGLVRLRPPAGPAFPGAYDFAFMPFFNGLGAYGFSLGAPDAQTELRPATFGDRIATLRLSMGERIRTVLQGATGAVASALITGERAGIPDAIENDLRVTGLAHVLSISGFHMALVAGFCMLAVRAALAAVPAISLRRSSKKLAAIVAIAASSFYFLLSGDNAATERSYIMIVVMLGAVIIDRPALTLRNVGIAALVVMALSPHVVMTATFQMSFAATAALVGAYGGYARWQARRGASDGVAASSRMRTIALVFVGLALSSIIAGAATAPFGIYHFQRAAPFGLVANLIATPIFSFWIMPLALVSVLAMPFGLEAPFLRMMGWGLDRIFEMCAVLARMFPDYSTGLMHPAALLAFCGAVLAISFFSSAWRWSAAVLVVLGSFLFSTGKRPEILVFEDGKEVALLRDDGLHYLRERPGAFVADQWARAFSSAPSDTRRAGADARSSGIETARAAASPKAVFECDDRVCRATSGSGLRIAWTDDYEKLDLLCETSDLAIVARAIRATECSSGARLVTLRSLRQTGSLAFYPAVEGMKSVPATSIALEPREWNRHRHAPWPEFWRRADNPLHGRAAPIVSEPTRNDAAVNDSGGSIQPDVPVP